jgi:hypothetical protein
MKRKTLLLLLFLVCPEVVIEISVERKELWSVEETESSCYPVCGVEIRDFDLAEKIRVLVILLLC